MCGVIGYFGNKTEQSLVNLQRLFEESQIRGKHATGLSYAESGNIISKVLPIPSHIFVKGFDFNCLPNKISLIGHTRYSTSDLEYNQPIYNEKFAIAHNGVITQQDPSNWEGIYEYKCNGKNDSELILQSIMSGNLPLYEFNESSLAVVQLFNTGEVLFFRNGNRPLWYTAGDDTYIASTKDILLRAIKGCLPIKCDNGYIYKRVGQHLFRNEVIISKERQTLNPYFSYYRKVVL